MNPVLQQMLGSLLRWALTFIAGYFVSKGIWTQEEASTYVLWSVGALLALLWAGYNQWFKQKVINTALAMNAGSTQDDAEKLIKKGLAPPATVDKDKAPFLKGEANPKLKGDE